MKKGDEVSSLTSPSCSVHFLGSVPSSFPSFRSLMNKCAKEGEFLSYESSGELLPCYAYDAQMLHSRIPLAVFKPHAISNIPHFVRACHELSIPIAIRCGGTGVAGGSIPPKEGIVLLTGHLRKIKSYDRLNGDLCLEPGVTIRQINQFVGGDGWHFPLSMQTEGVAGIAGCLSSGARGYHQQSRAMYDSIEQVFLVDGRGDVIVVPSHLVCGAEGLLGVIIEIKLRLERKKVYSLIFSYKASWEKIISKMDDLRMILGLESIIWKDEVFTIFIQTEEWRKPATISFLEKLLPGIQAISDVTASRWHSFSASKQPFAMVSSFFHLCRLPLASSKSVELAENLHLDIKQSTDLLTGGLHLIIESKEPLYYFQKKLEKFLAFWAEFTDCQQGKLAFCHGVGVHRGLQVHDE